MGPPGHHCLSSFSFPGSPLSVPSMHLTATALNLPDRAGLLFFTIFTYSLSTRNYSVILFYLIFLKVKLTLGLGNFPLSAGDLKEFPCPQKWHQAPAGDPVCFIQSFSSFSLSSAVSSAHQGEVARPHTNWSFSLKCWEDAVTQAPLSVTEVLRG